MKYFFELLSGLALICQKTFDKHHFSEEAIVIDTVFNRAEKTFIFQKISHTNTIECNCSLRCSRTSQSVEFLSRSCILT